MKEGRNKEKDGKQERERENKILSNLQDHPLLKMLFTELGLTFFH